MTIFASVRQFIAWAEARGHNPKNRSVAELFIRQELANEYNPDHAYRVRTYATT